jgi:hypothetical protein
MKKLLQVGMSGLVLLLAAPAAWSAPKGAVASSGPSQGGSSVLFGGIEEGKWMLEGQIGWPYYPRASFHYGISESFSVGPSISLGGASTWGFGIALGAPIRYIPWQSGKMSVALRADPGVSFGFLGVVAVGLNLPVSGHFGYGIPFNHKNLYLRVGGGLETGVSGFVSGVNGVSIPILIGPAAELRILPKLTVTMDFKFGPEIRTFATPGLNSALTALAAATGTTTSSIFVGFAYRTLAGVTYTF